MSQTGIINIPSQVAETYSANIGSASPSGGVLNIVGGAGITTSASGNTVTITNTDAISTLTFNTASGSATSSGGAITFTGAGGLNFSGSGSTVTGNLSAIPNSSLANSSVTIVAGTGLSGGGTVSLGGSVTINGTAITTTQYDVLVGGAGNTISGVGPGSSGQILQSGGASANPAYSTTTYPSTNAINTLLYASASNTMSALATATTAVLTTSAGVPTWASELSLALGGTNANLTASNGGIFYSTASAGAILSGTATAGQLLRSGASTAPTWTTTTYPTTNAINTLLYASSANVMAALATANNGVLTTGTTGIPGILAAGTSGALLQSGSPAAWTTATYPSTATSTGTILRANGTNWVATTATYPATTTINQILYSSSASVIGGITTANNGVLTTGTTGIPGILAAGTSGALLQSGSPAAWTTTTYPATNAINTLLYASAANVISALATANNGVLITSSGGVPSISSTLPTAVQENITSTGNLGNQTNTTRSAFSAYCSSAKSNVTGDGTVYTVLFDTKIFDQNTDYTAASGTFTAPVTGKYQFNWQIYFSGMTSSDTNVFTQFTLSSGQTILQPYLNPSSILTSGNFIMSGSAFVAMTAADTAVINVNVQGSTKTVSIGGGALSTNPSYFSGFLVC